MPLKEVEDLIIDLPRRGLYDEMFKCGEYLETITENLKFVKQSFNGQAFVDGREIVMLSGIVIRGETHYIIAKGVPEFDKNIPITKGLVRGELKIGGWILTKITDTSCKGIYMINSSLKGRVPQAIQKVAAKRQGNGVKQLKKVLENPKKK